MNALFVSLEIIFYKFFGFLASEMANEWLSQAVITSFTELWHAFSATCFHKHNLALLLLSKIERGFRAPHPQIEMSMTALMCQ